MAKNSVYFGTPNSPFLVTEEAAAYLRLDEETLKKMRCEGTGPDYRKHGGKVVYHIKSLKNWSKDKTYQSTGGTEV